MIGKLKVSRGPLVGLCLAALGGALIALVASTQHGQASSDDAWEEFRQDVEKACRVAAEEVLAVSGIQVDPFGSESYGFALLAGTETGSTSERFMVCAYDKATQKAEISSLFDR